MHIPTAIDNTKTFDVIENIEKNIQTLKNLRKPAIVCIGEYPIKTLLKQPSTYKDTLPILIEKSSYDIYKWTPKNFNPHFVLGFEDSKIDTHFFFNVLPVISKDETIIQSLKTTAFQQLHTAMIFTSLWDGIGSASLPILISKFKASRIDSLSIALLPSKMQPGDAHFNAYGALQLSSATEGATILLIDRDYLETYEGVDRNGSVIKGNSLSNYLLDIFFAKDLLIEEVSELSRSFNIKLFTPLIVAGASYKIYGSLENMLNTALLKPLLTFDLSSASLLYALLRIPSNLKDKLSRTKIELAITSWFKEKTTLQSIHVTEPIYTEDMSDRIDVVLFIGGFDTSQLFLNMDSKIKSLKRKAIQEGFITEDWNVLSKKGTDVPRKNILKERENVESLEEPSSEKQTVENTTLHSSKKAVTIKKEDKE